MFGKKIPLKQPPPQVYQDQYSQQQSQPLIQQVDESYQPTQKQVREYAIQTLGMKLPQDQSLLYLAREGLKAPIAANWVPYQSRNGQIYYKHNITQQKIYDHPTDIQYRKKYQQIKQKAARKNLKSISLKQNLGMQGLLPSTSLASGLGLINNSGIGGMSNASNLSGVDDQAQMTIDEQTLMKYQADLVEYERKQQKSWKQFQRQTEEQHEKKMKRLKQQAAQQRDRLLNKNNKKTQSRILQQNQNRLQQQLEQSQQSNLIQQLRIFEKEQQNKLQEYKAVYQQDNVLKMRKLQQELLQNYNEKSKALEDKLRKLQQKKQKQKQSRIKKLQQAKQQYEKPNNPQIINLLKSTLEDNINNIKIQYNKKLKQREDQLTHQLNQMKKILGVDKSQNLLALANKKQKLLIISNMKISAKKNKQIQMIENQYQKQLQKQKHKLKQKLIQQREQKIQVKKKQLQQHYQRTKLQLQNQYLQKSNKQIQHIYQNTTIQKNSYQSTMNKKMSQLRMQYINKISENGNKKGNQQKQDKIVNRVLTQQKQSQIANKQQILKNLKRQIQLQRQAWKVLLFENQITKIINQDDGNQKQLNSYLKTKIKGMNIAYKSPQLIRLTEIFKSNQQKYKQDKKLLVRILRGIQETAAYNIHEMRKNLHEENSANISSGALVKKYNEDVRKMRDNQDMLNKFETLIKKAELGGNHYQQNLQNLKRFVNEQMQYKQISLKDQIQQKNYRSQSSNHIFQNREREGPAKKLEQYNFTQKNSNIELKSKPQPWTAGVSTSANSMQQALRQHSQFLSNVKNQLNRKLYQIRYQYRY